jgi:hypothetical protein
MVRTIKKNNIPELHVVAFMIITNSFVAIASMHWHFWLLLDILLATLIIMHFSKQLRNIFNIHSIVVSLIVLYALPSSILVLQGKISMSDDEIRTLFSAIGAGLIGYAFGVWLFKILFGYERKKNTSCAVSKKVNALFWMTYKHRFCLTLLACAVLYAKGFMPRGMSYRESVAYRAATPGIVLYFDSLILAALSTLMISMVSIVGDVKKHKKLTLLSYFLVTLVGLSIIGGHRIWIIALFACLMIPFQPYLKRRHLLCIVVAIVLTTFLLSEMVSYARSGETLSENMQNFYGYFTYARNRPPLDSMRKWRVFTTPFSTFITIIKNLPQNIDFDYSAYFKDASLLIPTVMYPDRPLPPNKWYVKTFEPELFQRGAGKTFYVLGFGYLFAGLAGVFIHLCLFGFFFEWLNRFFKTIGAAAGLFLYCYFFMQMLRFVVGSGFVVFIKCSLILGFFIPIFLLFLCAGVLELLSPKNILCGKYLRRR